MISEFLFFEEDSEKKEKEVYIQLKIEVRELLKSKFNRKVLSDILLDLQKDVSGDTLQRLYRLYFDLGLHQDAYVKLRSWKWEVVSQGILELTQMRVVEAYGFITKFINDKRGAIRKQAEIATVTLRNEGINYFLDTTHYKISEWQQLKLLDVIRNLDDFEPPKFKAWLTATNKYVVLFALRLIKHYHQNDAYPSIVQLVRHRDDQIKSEAIQCIKEFHIVEARETLKRIFWHASVDIKLSILGTLADIGNESDIKFIQNIEIKELNFNVKSKALSTINAICPNSVLPTIEIMPFPSREQDDHDFETDSGETEESNRPTLREVTETDESEIPVQEEVVAAKATYLMDMLDCDLSNAKAISHAAPSSEIDLSFMPLVIATEEMEAKDCHQAISSIGIEDQKTEITLENGSENNYELSLSVRDALQIDFLPIVSLDKTEEITGGIGSDEKTNASENMENGATEDALLWEESQNNRELQAAPGACDLGDLFYANGLLKTYIDEEFDQLDLLDAIGALGDKREIPLLEKLLDRNGDDTNKLRIKELLERFSKEMDSCFFEKKPPLLADGQEQIHYSIFEELFRNCDTASKLILLNEIVAVGDEKELYFLSKLFDDPEKPIRKKAKEEHRKLSGRLSEEGNPNLVSEQEGVLVGTMDVASINRTPFKGTTNVQENRSTDTVPQTYDTQIECYFPKSALDHTKTKGKTIFDIDFQLDAPPNGPSLGEVFSGSSNDTTDG